VRRPKIVEVSLVFRGRDALENSEAAMKYLDSIEGVWSMLEGIRHFGGRVTFIDADAKQNILYFDGEMPEEKLDDREDGS